MRRIALLVVTSSLVLSGGAGCSWFGMGRKEPKPQRLSAGAFYQPSDAPSDAEERAGPVTPPMEGGTPAPLAPSASANVAELPPITDASENLTDKLLAVPPTPVRPPTTAPGLPSATVRQVTPSGTYMTLGGMLAEVNGTPIFASKVIKTLEPALAARAKELSPGAFEVEARRLIEKQVSEFVQDELLYAAAQRNLDLEDRKLADAITTEWRERRIREAGGSIEQAKRVAAESGDDFDQLVADQNRAFLIQIFREKKILPRVSVTTRDMRRYYRDNLQKQFTGKTQASFRLIRVDPARSGGKDAALARLREVETRAKAGEDFAKLASEINDDANLARRGGEVGPIDKGSMALEAVEAAVFRTEPGQLTEIVEDRGGFYLAKVTSRTLGSVQPFESAEVQNAVSRDLRSQQYLQIQDQYVAELKRGAVIRTDERMMQTALEMATQRYAVWHAN